MAFKTTKGSTSSLESPEGMYNDIRPRKIKGLISHQADVLRDYQREALDEPDVALQLPTGSGKTLVGLVLAEWRRRRFEERVVYVCPTRQLVNQVAQKANEEYGIRVHAFTGKQRDYDPAAKGEWTTGQAVAITTYNGLFNTNPFFDTPHIVIVDDAHAAENYIGNHWTVSISRWERNALFQALAGCLKPVIQPLDYVRLVEIPKSLWDQNWVDMIPMPALFDLIPQVIAIMDEHTAETPLQYPWSLLRDHLPACHLYIGTNEMAFRPILPPTNTHQPFSQAKQRIFMSATLGEGGELERVTGRKNIKRLAVPAGWDKQGIGQRFFMFPGHSLSDQDQYALLVDLMRMAARSLVLAPQEKAAEQVRTFVTDKLGFPTFSAQEIEQSKEPFTSSPQAVAVIANRYDGIDFPEDECRLLVILGLPRAINLQERFFVSRMAAVALLNDRIRTRIVQAFGRCTRSPTDFSAVVIFGEELMTYLMKKEGREYFHPELQAELRFGIEQSKDQDAASFRENFGYFIHQTPEWSEANGAIIDYRSHAVQKTYPGMDDLRASVGHEIDYVYALWRGDFVGALKACRKLLGGLTHPELKGYRALWNYLAGSAAWLATRTGMAGLEAAAREYFTSASKAAPNVSWLLTYGKEAGAVPTPSTLVTSLFERMEQVLEDLGTTHDRKYAKEEKDILEGLLNGGAKVFEQAHERLGRLLGYQAGNQETRGAPDPYWIVNERLCLVFEDHSDGKPGGALSVDKARQATTHPNWVKANLSLAPDAEIIPILVTPVELAEPEALAHLGQVALWSKRDFVDWAQRALTIVRQVRATFPGAGDFVWRMQAADDFRANGLDPADLIEKLKANCAAKLLKPITKKGS